jgi:hypothetical protein
VLGAGPCQGVKKQNADTPSHIVHENNCVYLDIHMIKKPITKGARCLEGGKQRIGIELGL